MLQKISKNKKYQGFSFIEAILSVFLISTGMIAVMSLMSSSLKESMSSRDQIVASFLTQEGVELVRNLRDNNWAGGEDTFDGFPSGDDMACSIDSNSASINDSPVNYNIPGMSDKFQRKIQVDYDDNTLKNTAEITSVVIWGGSFPSDPITKSNCNSSAKCAYTQTTLTRWGGM